jgi:membrane fusion protein (multidrug efflux system)
LKIASTSRVPLAVLLLAGVAASGGLWLLRTSPGAQAERERAAVAEGTAAGAPAPSSSVATVDAVVVRREDTRSRMDLAAVLEPVRKVVVGAEVAGKVVEIVAREHDHVAAGELLLRLDPELPQAVVDRARASLVRARASARLAQSELSRQRDLSERRVAAAAELDRAESEAATTEAQVSEARAALAEANTRLAKTGIVAPLAGVVTDLELEPGAYVQPGSPIAELVDLSEIEIEVQVADRQVVALHPGDPVEVTVDVFPGERFEGRILQVGRAPDARTRKYPVPVRVGNPDERLLPGMLGTVHFELGEARPALAVPRSALRREFELDYVFVLEGEPGDGARARRQRVSTRPLPFQPELVEVTDGLDGGERIAVSGVRDLRDGARVDVLLRGGGS